MTENEKKNILKIQNDNKPIELKRLAEDEVKFSLCEGSPSPSWFSTGEDKKSHYQNCVRV